MNKQDFMKKEDAGMDHMNRMFRKATFGGFNKEDVMQYIENMKNEFFDYKAQVEETIRTLNEKLALAEPNAPAAQPAAEQPADTATSINEATAHLKQVADELCDKMNRLLGRIRPEENEEAAPEPPQPAEPATPDDKVEQLLNHLFTGEAKGTAAPVPKAPASLGDVLPAYCK